MNPAQALAYKNVKNCKLWQK